MFKRFRLFLGPQRIQWLFMLFAFTGLASLILNAAGDDGADWIEPAQNALLAIFIGGAAIIIGGRMEPHERGRWLGILIPALGMVLLGVFFFPDQLLLLMGGAIGWVLAGMFLFRARGPMEYQQAIKAFRKNNYDDAIAIISDLIKNEPKDYNHYRLRAEFFRVTGKFDRARKDYQKIVNLMPDDAPDKWVGYNGMSEVALQMNDIDDARKAAQQAYEMAPEQWVTAFNLGMVEDRAHNPEAAITHLQQALANKVPDSHYRFLIHFYLARNYARLGNMDAAHEAVKQMKAHGGGLNQWQIILQSDQADTLRAVLGDDIKAAEAIFNDEMTVDDLITANINS